MFLLDARLELTPKEQHFFEKYELPERVIYNSEAFLRHLQAADKYREVAAKERDLSKIVYNCPPSALMRQI
jgi:hypothetical protein